MTFLHFLMSAPRVSVWVGVGGNQKNDHARGSVGLRVRSEWTRVRAREFWSQSYEALLLSFASSLGDLQHKSWCKVRLFWQNTFDLVCDNYFSRMETDRLVERAIIHRLLWSWTKSRQLWRQYSRDRKLDRRNSKFNRWVFKTREISPTISTNTQHLGWHSTKEVRQYKEYVQRTLVRARRAYYDNNQLMGRSGSISYEEMKKMVEENLTVEKVGIEDCW